MTESSKRASAGVKTARMFYPGLEYIRLAFMVLIVAWHFQILGPAKFYAAPTAINPVDFVYFTVFLLGVPVFFIISMFLYVQGRRQGYFVKRVVHLATFLIFWNIVAFLLFANQATLPTFTTLLQTIQGGYGPLYFILGLILVTCITEVICTYHERARDKRAYIKAMWVLLIIFLLASALKTFVLQPGNIATDYLLSYKNILDFVPYGIAAFLISEHLKHKKRPKWDSRNTYIGLAVVGVVVSAVEFVAFSRLLPETHFYNLFPSYNRISLFILTVAVFMIFLRSTRPLNKYVAFLAGLTGGVFIIHHLLLTLVVTNFPAGFAQASQYPLVLFAIALPLSFAFSWLLKERRLV